MANEGRHYGVYIKHDPTSGSDRVRTALTAGEATRLQFTGWQRVDAQQSDPIKPVDPATNPTPGLTDAVNNTGAPERVLTAEQLAEVAESATPSAAPRQRRPRPPAEPTTGDAAPHPSND